VKILYHHRTAAKDGQAVHIDEMIAALRARGCELIVVGPPIKAKAVFGSGTAGVSWLRKALPRALMELLEVAYSVVAYRRLRDAVRRHRPDVFYERHNLYLLAGKWLKARYELPFLLEVNSPMAIERHRADGLALPGLAQRLEADVWRSADVVLPVTRVLGDILIDHGVCRDRVEVIPNGINLQAFLNVPSRADAKRQHGIHDRFVLGFTGFVRSWHALDQVIDFIAEAKRNDLFLLVVGDGPARDELLQHARLRGVADQVRFTGVVDHTEIPRWAAAFDVALQPAANAYASPLKLFEYLALGCTIVAPKQPNILEILADGENAVLFDPAVPRSLFAAIERVTADASLRERLGEAARNTIVQQGLTWDRNAERVIALAQRLRANLPAAQTDHLRAPGAPKPVSSDD
jgi:glycosyltransferase involved in cell wall biosynthesis